VEKGAYVCVAVFGHHEISLGVRGQRKEMRKWSVRHPHPWLAKASWTTILSLDVGNPENNTKQPRLFSPSLGIGKGAATVRCIRRFAQDFFIGRMNDLLIDCTV
jgi:hypothetical protein